MKASTIVTFLILTFKITIAHTPENINLWIIWNIGQGQWVTHVLPFQCHHFDAGGEFGSFIRVKKKLISACSGKTNTLSVTHWDYDHILNISSMARSFPALCWRYQPTFKAEKKSVLKILKLSLPICKKRFEDASVWVPQKIKTTNDSSAVFLSDNVLITGDSPIKQEKIWAESLKNIKTTKLLILGHHGSRTSTGIDLLQHLPNLKMAIASARYRKYRHPHPETLHRLANFRIPVLKTEDWGNIQIEN